MSGGARAGSPSGASLVEVVVATTILAMGLGLAARTLHLAARELDIAALDLRAVLLLSELHEAWWGGSDPAPRPVGLGLLDADPAADGLGVVYEPRVGSSPPDALSRGYGEDRRWIIEVEP